MMNHYQKEQLDALIQVRDQLATLKGSLHEKLIAETVPYFKFRHRLENFLDKHMGGYCSRTCYESQTSACCSKDGVVTFWADVVINTLSSTSGEMASLIQSIKKPAYPNKCIYLTTNGCRWRVRPLVCAMFVCDQIQIEVINRDEAVKASWRMFLEEAKSFRWPDRPVLFDHLEAVFINRGCRSPLMYLNQSPGLLRIKKSAGLI